MKWILLLLTLISITSYGQTDDSTKYVWYRYQYGSRMPRMWSDSVQMIPLSTSPHTPSRKGGIRYSIVDSTIQAWTGFQWRSLGAGGGGTWGSITGTLSDQTDLQNSLDGKVNISDTSGMLSGYTRLQRFLDSLAAIRGDFPATPTLQQVTDAGNTTTTPIIGDSIRSRSITADSSLYAPIRAALDSINTATRRGDIRFDTSTNSMMYRDNDFWTYFASLTNAMIPNRPNMRLIAGVFRPTIDGSVITWNWIINASHDSIGFGPITCDGSNVVLSLSTTAAKIHTIVAVPDEALAGQIDVGVSFQTTAALVRILRRFGTKNTILRGNNTTYVKTDAPGSAFTMSYTSGNLRLDWQTAFSTAAYAPIVSYVGPNGYHLERYFSGLGGFDAGWLVKDGFGNTVTDAPLTTDAIDVSVPEWSVLSINPCVAGGDGWANAMFGGGFSNIWVFGLIEL